MSSLDYQETLRNVAWLAVPEIADWCAVDLVDEARQPPAGGRRPPRPREARSWPSGYARYDPEQLDPDAGRRAE